VRPRLRAEHPLGDGPAIRTRDGGIGIEPSSGRVTGHDERHLVAFDWRSTRLYAHHQRLRQLLPDRARLAVSVENGEFHSLAR
jgi:hypothetical protein